MTYLAIYLWIAGGILAIQFPPKTQPLAGQIAIILCWPIAFVVGVALGIRDRFFR